MKKILFLFLFTPAFANAQFSKGDAFLGGTASGSYVHTFYRNLDNRTHQENIGYGLGPSVGFLISSRFALGGTLKYQYFKYRYYEGTYKQYGRATSYSAAITGRYFFPVTAKFLFALSGDIYYIRSKSKIEYTDGETHELAYEAGVEITPTFLYFPSPHWGFEANVGSLYFAHAESLSKDDSSDNISISLSRFSLGVAYYFRRP
jgi:hypothetical protein